MVCFLVGVVGCLFVCYGTPKVSIAITDVFAGKFLVGCFDWICVCFVDCLGWLCVGCWICWFLLDGLVGVCWLVWLLFV